MIKKTSHTTNPLGTAGDGFFRRTLSFAGIAASLTAIAVLPSHAFAQEEPAPLFAEDFQDYWDWADLDPGLWWSSNIGGHVRTESDWSNFFGQGSENIMLYINKVAGNPPQAFGVFGEFSAEVGRFSFDLYHPGDGGGDSDEIWFFLYSGSRNTNNRAQYIEIGKNKTTIGSSGQYQRDAVNHIEFVFNNSDESVLYGDDDLVLLAGTTDIWVNGELVESGYSRHNNKRGPVTAFEFNSRGSAGHTLYIDNIVVEAVESGEVGVIVAPPAEIILHDDFSSHEAGKIPGAPWTSVTDDPEKTGSSLVEKDTANLFGKGPDNQYLNYLPAGDGAIVTRSENTFSSELITFSMKFIDADDNDPTYSWIIFNSGSVSGTANRVHVFTLNSEDGIGTIRSGNYPLNVPNQLDLVINSSAFTVEYGDGYTIESGKADIWINGVLAEAGYSGSYDKLGPVTTFEFNIGGSRTKHLLVDEITIWNSAHISEAPAPSDGFADWRTTYFPEDADNDEISGPEANPSGDGVSNLIKYALGLDPTVASRDGLPESNIQDIDGTDYLTLTFERPANRDDVSLTVVASGTLSTWEDEAVHVETIDNGAGSVTEVWRDVEPIEEAGARFLRLEVSLE